MIRTALESFVSDLDSAPGRFNLLDVHGATVVLDYGHNPSSLACLIEALNPLPHQRRRLVTEHLGDDAAVSEVVVGLGPRSSFPRTVNVNQRARGLLAWRR